SEKVKYTNDDLPAGYIKNGLWRGTLIPTYGKWYGSLYNPWGAKDTREVKVLQFLWDHIYGGSIPTVVKIDGPIHYISNQRTIKWCSGITSASISMITSLVASNPQYHTANRLCEFAKFWLKDKHFLFKDVSAEDKRDYTGMWQSPFILQVFAAHLNHIQGAVDAVPAMENHNFTPRAALALSAVAV
ncbi:hypothetical protein BJ138DRAFT_994608, partial [Hygrophoropsis aurantiaca]